MSLYSTSISTAIIDPSFTSTRRCEFRIPFANQAYLPNLRLGGIGVSCDAPTAYALGVGVASIIKRITLLDGEEEIDSLREANAWLTFKSFWRANSEAASIKIPLEGGAGRGITSSITMATEVPLPMQKFANTAIQAAKNSQLFSGTVDLRSVFPILNSISHLSTNTFKNLRVVMEYETDQGRILTNTTKNALPLVPFLMADEITDEALIATLDKQLMANPVRWDVIEVDRIGLAVIPDADTAAKGAKTQNVSLQSNGFLGKYVKRICVQKSAQDPSLNSPTAGGVVYGFGGNGSTSMNKEQVNMRINGRSLLAGQGYVTAGQMAMGVSDSWGEINAPPYGAIQSVGLDDARTAAVNAPAGVADTNPSILEAGISARHAATTGQQSYCGFRIDSKVDALQLEYQRTGRFQAATAAARVGTASALDLTLFAEVSKVLEVMGGGVWRIAYV